MSWFTRDDKPGTPITREKILAKLQALWPDLVWGKTTCPGNVWFGDMDYLMPALKAVSWLVILSTITPQGTVSSGLLGKPIPDCIHRFQGPYCPVGALLLKL